MFGEIPKNVIINNSKSIEYETIDNEKLKLIISIDGVKYSEELFYAYYKDGKIHYNIPAEVFKNNLTTAGDFQYDTDVSTTYGLTATLSAGESIFWKLSKTKTL